MEIPVSSTGMTRSIIVSGLLEYNGFLANYYLNSVQLIPVS